MQRKDCLFFIIVYLQNILHCSECKINNYTNKKLLQKRRVSFTCCKISVPVTPLHMIFHEQVDHGVGLLPSLGIWRCRETHASAVRRDAVSLQICNVGVRQEGRTCGTALGTPELLTLQWDSPCIWLCCSLNPLSGISLLFLSIFRVRQRSKRRLLFFKAMRTGTESLHIFHPLLRVRVAWKKSF